MGVGSQPISVSLTKGGNNTHDRPGDCCEFYCGASHANFFATENDKYTGIDKYFSNWKYYVINQRMGGEGKRSRVHKEKGGERK